MREAVFGDLEGFGSADKKVKIMSDRQLENAMRIADYLEDRMSPEEEEGFMLELGGDEEMRRQYEEEMLIRAGMKGEVGPGLLQPADEHLQLVTEILAKDKEVRRDRGRVAVFGRRGVAAAALLVIISGTVLYIRFGWGEHGTSRVIVANSPALKNRMASGVAADSLFARYFTSYASGGDPVEVSLYYEDYKRGDYPAVIGAKEEEYQVMGAGGREKVIRGYMQLYKGLSYLAVGKAVEAVAQLEAVKPGNACYDAARWYLALAWLRRGDMSPGEGLNRARSIALEIANSSSRYKDQARRLSGEPGL